MIVLLQDYSSPTPKENLQLIHESRPDAKALDGRCVRRPIRSEQVLEELVPLVQQSHQAPSRRVIGRVLLEVLGQLLDSRAQPRDLVLWRPDVVVVTFVLQGGCEVRVVRAPRCSTAERGA